MSNTATRYDTLVIRGSTSKEVPREAAGGEVVSWAAGHALAESGPLEEFVSDLVDGNYSSVDAIEEQAHKVLELSRRQRDYGWLDQKQADAPAATESLVRLSHQELCALAEEAISKLSRQDEQIYQLKTYQAQHNNLLVKLLDLFIAGNYAKIHDELRHLAEKLQDQRAAKTAQGKR